MNNEIRTTVTEQDLECAVNDGHGGLYSSDGKRLLKYESIKGITSYVVKPDTEIICEYAFRGCSSVQCIELPNSIEIIGKSAFSGCTKLSKIHLPNNLKDLGEMSFDACYDLTTIELPTSIQHIGAKSFSECYSLSYVKILNPTPPSINKKQKIADIDIPICVPEKYIRKYNTWKKTGNYIMSIEEYESNLAKEKDVDLSKLLLGMNANGPFSETERMRIDYIDYCYLPKLSFLGQHFISYSLNYADNESITKIYSKVVYFLCPEDKTAIAYVGYIDIYTHIKKAFIYGAEDEPYYGLYTVKYVYIRYPEWQGSKLLCIPKTVKNIYIDKLPFEKGDEFNFVGGSFWFCDAYYHNQYLRIEDEKVYNKDKTTLLCVSRDVKVLELSPTLYKCAPYSLFNAQSEVITIPSGIVNFDMPFMKSKSPKFDFQGAVKSLNVPKNSICRINNFIENVTVSGRDAQLDRGLVFKAPMPDTSDNEGKCIHLTRAGALPLSQYSRYYLRGQMWSCPVTVNIDHVAFINPIKLDCYDEHDGCEIFIMNKEMIKHFNRETWPSFFVYESYELVLAKLKKTGWTGL